MTPIVTLYVLRVILGIVAGAITATVAFWFGNPTALSSLLNSISIAIIIYFITYYVFKASFKNKVEKQSKILSTGIGMYFFTWLAFFVLIYTAIIVYVPV